MANSELRQNKFLYMRSPKTRWPLTIGGLNFQKCIVTVRRPAPLPWGHAHKGSPGIIRKSRVSYPGPGFLSRATWPSLPKKHYDRLINQSTYHTDI